MVKVNFIVISAFIMVLGVVAAAPGDRVYCLDNGVHHIVMPATYEVDTTEALIAATESGAQMIGVTENITLMDCIESTNIAIHTSNATVDNSTGVDSVSLRLSVPGEFFLPLNDISAPADTIDTSGDLTFELRADLFKISQLYNDETSFSSTIDLQLEEL